jgi:uncharacterized protein (DUF488 family)
VIKKSDKVWTVGHSTRAIVEFVAALKAHGIEIVVDVRSFPGSRRYPQFGKDRLAASLAEAGIEYEHFAELGGRRRARPDSRNVAWRNEGFRGYADYMETANFRGGIEGLMELARSRRAAIMCAEALWWRCHRSLISDYLKAAGAEVIHIIDAERAEPHPFTSAARIVNGELSYRALLDE